MIGHILSPVHLVFPESFIKDVLLDMKLDIKLDVKLDVERLLDSSLI